MPGGWLGLRICGHPSDFPSHRNGEVHPRGSLTHITLQDASRLAKAYSPQFQTAVANASLAKEKRLQARDARLPTVRAFNQFIYTEGNRTPSGVFVANDGIHVYNEQAIVRQDFLALVRNGTSVQARKALREGGLMDLTQGWCSFDPEDIRTHPEEGMNVEIEFEDGHVTENMWGIDQLYQIGNTAQTNSSIKRWRYIDRKP